MKYPAGAIRRGIATDPCLKRDLPWQQLQRRLAQATTAGGEYSAALAPIQRQWRFANTPGSWLSRPRPGVTRRRQLSDERARTPTAE